MLFEVLKLELVLREEECLLHCINHKTIPSIIEVPDGGVWGDGGSVQDQEGIPGMDPRRTCNDNLGAHDFTGNSLLLASSRLGSLSLFLRRLALSLSLLRNLLARYFLSFSLFVNRLGRRRLRGRGVGYLGTIRILGVAFLAWDSNSARRLGVFFWITIPSSMLVASWLVLTSATTCLGLVAVFSVELGR